MSNSPEGRRSPIRCINCGAILTGRVFQDDTVYPVGVDDDGKCGNGEFEVLSMPDTGIAGGQTTTRTD